MVRRLLKGVVPHEHRRRLRRLPREVAARTVYRGDAVFCPCCEHGHRRFLPHRGRPHAACPRCGSLERHRVLLLFLRDELGLFESHGRLLHFAPERSLEQRLRDIAGLEYISVDLDPGRAMVGADITALPFDDDDFDFVICSHVLEHVEDDRRAIANLFRVLAPDGFAIVIVPIRRAETYEAPNITDSQERLRHFGQADHVREIGADYYLRLAEAGFTVERRTYALELPPEARERFGLRANELYVCTKGERR